MSTRRGKVARLPQVVREMLNERLADGQKAKEALEWLNGLAEVKEVMEKEFEGEAVSEQNLSQWRKGGYVDWRRQERIDRLAESSDGLEEKVKGTDLGDRLATVFAAEMACLADELMELSDEPEKRWKQLKGLMQELVPLRRQNHRAVYARIAQSKQERQQVLWEREDEEYEDKEQVKYFEGRKQEILKPIMARRKLDAMAPLFGNDPDKLAEAAYILEVQNLLPAGTLGRTNEEWEARGKEADTMSDEEWLMSKGLTKEQAKERIKVLADGHDGESGRVGKCEGRSAKGECNSESSSTEIVYDYKGDDEREKKKELIRKIAAEIRRRLGESGTDGDGEEKPEIISQKPETEGENESEKVGQGESEGED